MFKERKRRERNAIREGEGERGVLALLIEDSQYEKWRPLSLSLLMVTRSRYSLGEMRPMAAPLERVLRIAVSWWWGWHSSMEASNEHKIDSHIHTKHHDITEDIHRL